MLISVPMRDGSAAALLRWTRSREATVHVSCMVIVPNGAVHIVSLYDAGVDLVITRPTELDVLSRRVAATLARRIHLLMLRLMRAVRASFGLPLSQP